MVNYISPTARQVSMRPYRSDNCVKNHFYSKLRKAIRKLNKIITEHFAKDLRSIKNCMLSKII